MTHAPRWLHEETDLEVWPLTKPEIAMAFLPDVRPEPGDAIFVGIGPTRLYSRRGVEIMHHAVRPHDRAALAYFDAHPAEPSPSAEKPSWRSVADRLGHRLSFASCEDHDPTEESARDCPYCADVMAYRAYVARLAMDGIEVRDPLAGSTTVSIGELMKGDAS